MSMWIFGHVSLERPVPVSWEKFRLNHVPLKKCKELKKKTINISVVYVTWKEDDRKVSGKSLNTFPPKTDSSAESTKSICPITRNLSLIPSNTINRPPIIFSTFKGRLSKFVLFFFADICKSIYLLVRISYSPGVMQIRIGPVRKSAHRWCSFSAQSQFFGFPILEVRCDERKPAFHTSWYFLMFQAK